MTAQRQLRFKWLLAALLLLGILSHPTAARAQMVSGSDMPGYGDVFQVDPKASLKFDAYLTTSSVPGNIMWPGDQPSFTVQIVNNDSAAITGSCKFDIIAYGTQGIPGDIWTPKVYKIGDIGSIPFTANIPVGGFQNVDISPTIPATFGAYAIIVDLGPEGRKFVTTAVRTFAADPARVQYPHFCLDALPTSVLSRLGVHAIRMDVGYVPTTSASWPGYHTMIDQMLKDYSDANVDVLFMCGGAPFNGPWQPMGRPRTRLDDNGVMNGQGFDIAWIPAYDDDFQKFVTTFATEYGWPKGSINSFTLWNEPWEGGGISGWMADMPRYREMYKHMAAGVDAARAGGAQILVGGCDSTSNAQDKLFPDGKDTFLNSFDFVSIHYQGLAPDSTLKMWVDRKGPNGRVKIWDTESWVANTDDRVAAVVASDRAAGYDRAMGIFRGNIAEPIDTNIRTADGKGGQAHTVNAWSVSAAVGAATHFIGERDFNRILFKNGLPWVMLFDGMPTNGVANPDDGTIVVVGDLGEEYGSDQLLFRTARGYAEIAHKKAMRAQLAAMPSSTSDLDRQALIDKINAPESLTGATMTLPASPDYNLYDPYGNIVPPADSIADVPSANGTLSATGGNIVVPLDGRGFFLRGSGAPGSFAKLVAAVQSSYITGIEPLATVAHDMLAPIGTHPMLHLSLTNILNRPISGTATVTFGSPGMLAATIPALSFAANETKEVDVKIIAGSANASNTYPMHFAFDAGADGLTNYSEDMHVNVIAHRTIKVDGNLDDWKGVLPQTIITNEKAAPTLTEAAWYPMKHFDKGLGHGFATAYLAYDSNYFYFAAKIADDTPDPGMVRMATLDSDQFFYPEHPGVAIKSSDNFQGDWSGQITAPTTDTYTFTIRANCNAVLTIDGQRIIDNEASGTPVVVTGTAALKAGQHYNFQLDVRHNNLVPLVLQVKWQTPTMPIAVIPSAAFTSNASDTQPAVAGRLSRGINGPEGQLFDSSPVVPNYDVESTDPSKAVDVMEQTLTWPAGVPRFTYRKDPDLPSGTNPAHDNVQIAFNVLPDSDKPKYPFPPGTMKGFINYADTDYEYALNPVAAKYGGGTEIWRMNVPGMPHKHFYPREPASPLDGAVTTGQLKFMRDATTRIVEAAIPWSEIPAVKARLLAGETIKFSYRVNDNANPVCMELAKNRSVSKRNNSAFHNDWNEHWANEVEFAFAK